MVAEHLDASGVKKRKILLMAEKNLKEVEQNMRKMYSSSNPWILGNCLFEMAEIFKNHSLCKKEQLPA